MYHAKASKSINFRADTGLTGITNAGTCAIVAIDTLGYDFASIDVALTKADVVSNKPTVFKLREADVSTTNSTTIADVSGFVGGTDWTIPNANTSVDNIYRFDVDCRARKRYLFFTISPATTQEINVNVRLSRAEQGPVSATQQGVIASVSG